MLKFIILKQEDNSNIDSVLRTAIPAMTEEWVGRYSDADVGEGMQNGNIRWSIWAEQNIPPPPKISKNYHPSQVKFSDRQGQNGMCTIYLIPRNEELTMIKMPESLYVWWKGLFASHTLPD